VTTRRILVVDDEPEFSAVITTLLKQAGFAVTLAEDGLRGRDLAVSTHPDLIVLDWNLPRMDGLALCKWLKSDPETRDIPVILLTVRNREDDTVAGLGMGADDYVSKRSLRPRELIARIQTKLRPSVEPTVIRAGDLTIHPNSRQVELKGQAVDLQRMEFDLLCHLVQNEGRVFSREQIIEAIWTQDYGGTNRTVDSTLGRLRLKLGVWARRLRSVRGVGYIFTNRPE
jgi:DNA-binding response OmpR family regulator